MCENCYIEEGSPKIVTPYIMDAVNKIKILYATESGELGGYGHIVFDDWNLEDHSIRSSIDSAFNCEYKNGKQVNGKLLMHWWRYTAFRNKKDIQQWLLWMDSSTR